MSYFTFLYEGPGVLGILETRKFYKTWTEKIFFFKKYFIFCYDFIIILFEEFFFSIDFLLIFFVSKIPKTPGSSYKNVKLDIFYGKVA